MKQCIKILEYYIAGEKDTLKRIEKLEGNMEVGSIKWKMHRKYTDRLQLLQDIKNQLI